MFTSLNSLYKFEMSNLQRKVNRDLLDSCATLFDISKLSEMFTFSWLNGTKKNCFAGRLLTTGKTYSEFEIRQCRKRSALLLFCTLIALLPNSGLGLGLGLSLKETSLKFTKTGLEQSLRESPIFLETFADQTLQQGPPLSLKCIASGQPLPQVTWLLDGQLVPENTRFRTGDYVTRDGLLVSYVNITSVSTQDGGSYECTASNEISSIKHKAKINIFGPPFIRQMKNVSTVAGETLIVHCPAGGYPIESIFWEKDNLRLPHNHRQKVYPNGTLVVTDLERLSDEGAYKCIARNSDGKSAQNSLYVIVLVRPVIDAFSFSSLQQGQRYHVLCSVTKGDPPVQIEWLKEGKPIEKSSNDPQFSGINIIHVTEFSSTLSFESLRPEHSGNYSCEASNIAGSVTHNASMVVHVQPKWRFEPIDVAVIKGQTAIIDCQADGFPPPRIRWSKGEGFSETPPSEFKAINSSPHLRVFENGSLALHNTQKSDAGYYLCQANNGIGAGLSKVLRLSVHVAAHFESKFRAETARKGHEVKLRCEAVGDKRLTINWLKDKLPFSPQEDPRYELSETEVSGGLISEIVIRSADRRDSALFSCITSNAYGHDDTNIQLIMQEPPDPPQDVRVIDIISRSAKVLWAPAYGGNSPIQSYVVQHKSEGEKWGSKTGNITVPGAETSLYIRNLRPVTHYQLRVFAVNSIGKSEQSEVKHFKTDEEAPGGPPLHIKAFAMSSTSIRVTWKPPRNDVQYGTIKGYYIGYKVISEKEHSDTFTYKTLEVKERESLEECHLTSLKRFTKYVIVVQAFNGKGPGPASEEIVAQTLQNDPPNSRILKVVSTSKSSIRLSWSLKLESDHETTPVTEYTLHQKKGDAVKWDEFRLPGDRTSHAFEGLLCGTRYQYYITATNAAGKGDPSDILSSKTDGMAPVAPDKHSLLTINSSSASIHLDAWHDGGCPIISVRIMYKMQKNRTWTNVKTDEQPLLEKTVVISDLLPSTTYDLKITATNEGGSTEAQYFFSTFHAPREVSSVTFGNNEASSAPSYVDVSAILATCVSLIVIFVVLLLLCVLLVKRRQSGTSLYGTNAGVYDTAKCQSQTETLRLSDMDQNHMKKLSSDSNSGLDSGYYPSPYAMTKLEMSERGLNPNIPHSHTSPMKPHVVSSEGEPLYATVKRTPRPPRSDVHIYHYPMSVQGTVDSGCDAESWKNTAETSAAVSTAFIRIQEEPCEKTLAGMSPNSMSSLLIDHNRQQPFQAMQAPRRLSQHYPR